MARKVRHSALESRSARLKLPVRRRPYSGPSLARGVSLMFRRCKGNGSWVLKSGDGHGAYWTKRIADADDFADADGKNTLTYLGEQHAGQMQARACGVVRIVKLKEAARPASAASGFGRTWTRLDMG